MTKSKYYYIRNAARILGAISCIFYLFISYKGGLVKVMQGSNDNLVPFFPFLAIAIAGFLASFVQIKKGSFIMLAGGVALFVFFLVYSHGADWMRAATYGMPFILSASALVYCGEKE